MAISTRKAKQRGRIAGITRAVNNGERPANDPALNAAYLELAIISVEEDADTLAAKARALVAGWPDLTPEQLGRIASALPGGGD